MMGKHPNPAVQPAPATPAPGQMGKRAGKRVGVVGAQMTMADLDKYRGRTGQGNAMPRTIQPAPAGAPQRVK